MVMQSLLLFINNNELFCTLRKMNLLLEFDLVFDFHVLNNLTLNEIIISFWVSSFHLLSLLLRPIYWPLGPTRTTNWAWKIYFSDNLYLNTKHLLTLFTGLLKHDVQERKEKGKENVRKWMHSSGCACGLLLYITTKRIIMYWVE